MPEEIENERPPVMPGTRGEMLWYLLYYDRLIFVREQRADGAWGAVALAELPMRKRAVYIARWLEAGRMPARGLDESEIEEKKRREQNAGGN